METEVLVVVARVVVDMAGAGMAAEAARGLGVATEVVAAVEVSHLARLAVWPEGEPMVAAVSVDTVIMVQVAMGREGPVGAALQGVPVVMVVTVRAALEAAALVEAVMVGGVQGEVGMEMGSQAVAAMVAADSAVDRKVAEAWGKAGRAIMGLGVEVTGEVVEEEEALEVVAMAVAASAEEAMVEESMAVVAKAKVVMVTAVLAVAVSAVEVRV